MPPFLQPVSLCLSLRRRESKPLPSRRSQSGADGSAGCQRRSPGKKRERRPQNLRRPQRGGGREGQPGAETRGNCHSRVLSCGRQGPRREAVAEGGVGGLREPCRFPWKTCPSPLSRPLQSFRDTVLRFHHGTECASSRPWRETGAQEPSMAAFFCSPRNPACCLLSPSENSFKGLHDSL